MHERRLSEEEVILLARTAQAMMHSADSDRTEARRFLECAAAAGDRDSQLSLGLWLARMDLGGRRDDSIEGIANYKEAIRWLSMAGAQGLGTAWYAISRIYQKAAFSQRSVAQAHHYLAMAAESGYDVAQRELGMLIWRTRKSDAASDVRAVYWLRQAAAQGCRDAAALLGKLASRPAPAPWALVAQRQLLPDAYKVPQVLAARIALAARVGLTIPEALLVDLHTADRGHCLMIDIRAHYARGRRRLILIDSEDDRREVGRIAHALDQVDCGPEGRYRQRLYRLRRTLPDWEAVRMAEQHAPFSEAHDGNQHTCREDHARDLNWKALFRPVDATASHER